MHQAVILRSATVDDAPVIVEIIRQRIPSAQLSGMIYSTDGIASYIAQQIAVPAADTVFALASKANTILGCIELRLLPECLFLNYIAVRPTAANMGIGSRLLKYGLEKFRQPWHRKMRLDVFQENEVARSWYEKLGFRDESKNTWWEIPLLRQTEAPGTYLSGYPQADVCHKAFGFSHFSLNTSIGVYTIGRLSDSWYRLTEPDALADPAVLPTLAWLDQQRRLLAILPTLGTKSLAINTWKQMTLAVRMVISIDDLALALKSTP